jgi:hypothetical protein
MSTGEIVREQALELARSGVEREYAVTELLTSCDGRRVTAVRARQQLTAWVDSEPEQVDAIVAIGLLDEVVGRLPG